MPNTTDWRAMRALFPCTEGQAYLDTASFAPGATPVVEAVRDHLAQWSTGRWDWKDWDGAGERVRRGLGSLLETDPVNVALLPSLATAAGQVAECLPVREGANLVVGDGEFQSNYFPWANQERRGLEVRHVPFHDGRPRLEDFAARIDGRTTLVAASHVQSASGSRIDVEELVLLCRRHGARLFLDATQSFGALRMPTEGIDYVAGAAYKWLLSPRGTAWMYTSPERAVEMAPLAPSWKTHAHPYENYYGPPFDPPADARRFDTSLAWPVWIGFARALELLEEVGLARIEERVLDLSRRFCTGLESLGLSPACADGAPSHIVGLRASDPEAVRAALADHQVVAAVRGSFVRFSFHFFNDESDIQRALEALAAGVK